MKFLIAVCGKSASGKDTIAQGLAEELECNLVVNDTSRPMRKGEVQDLNYHFVDREFILHNPELYLCRSIYRGWMYGTRKAQLVDGLNVGVFSPSDLLQLREEDGITVIPVYLDINEKERMRRSKERNNGRYSFEIIRRKYADRKSFRNIDHIVRTFDSFIKYYDNKSMQYRDYLDKNTRYRYNVKLYDEVRKMLERMGAF